MEFVEPVAAPTPPITIRFHMDTHLAALFLGLHHPRALFPAQIYLSVSCPLTSASCLSMPLVIPLPPETWLFCFVFFGHPSFPWLNCPLPGSLPSLTWRHPTSAGTNPVSHLCPPVWAAEKAHTQPQGSVPFQTSDIQPCHPQGLATSSYWASSDHSVSPDSFRHLSVFILLTLSK